MHAMLSCEPRLTTTKRSPIFNAPPRQLCVRTTSSSTRQLRNEAKGEEGQEEPGEEGNRVIGEKETGKNNECLLTFSTWERASIGGYFPSVPASLFPITLFPSSPSYPLPLFPASPVKLTTP